jgi:serine/threonine-protein kinase RsbW
VLLPGARLLLYTDGLVERRNRGLEDQLDRLLAELAARRAAPLEALVTGLAESMLRDQTRADDTCVLAFAFGAPPGLRDDAAASVRHAGTSTPGSSATPSTMSTP